MILLGILFQRLCLKPICHASSRAYGLVGTGQFSFFLLGEFGGIPQLDESKVKYCMHEYDTRSEGTVPYGYKYRLVGAVTVRKSLYFVLWRDAELSPRSRVKPFFVADVGKAAQWLMAPLVG